MVVRNKPLYYYIEKTNELFPYTDKGFRAGDVMCSYRILYTSDTAKIDKIKASLEDERQFRIDWVKERLADGIPMKDIRLELEEK